METLTVEKPEQITWDYDREADYALHLIWKAQAGTDDGCGQWGAIEIY